MTESELLHEYDRAMGDAMRIKDELERKRQQRQTEMQMQRPPEVQRQFDEAANGKVTVVDTVACEPSSPPHEKPVIFNPAATALCLDLGSGPRPAAGFKGVDIVPGITDYCVKLDSGRPWPFENNSVEQFRSSHFIEHIRAEYIQVVSRTDFNDTEEQDALFWFFDEAFRCAKPGATFQLIWPALKNARAFQDPTHRRFIPGETMLYLDAKWRELNGLQHYNVRCDWVLEAVSPTIPEIEARAHQGDEGAKILQRRLSREWNLEQDTTATLRARK